jgi:hypothetical protein
VLKRASQASSVIVKNNQNCANWSNGHTKQHVTARYDIRNRLASILALHQPVSRIPISLSGEGNIVHFSRRRSHQAKDRGTLRCSHQPSPSRIQRYVDIYSNRLFMGKVFVQQNHAHLIALVYHAPCSDWHRVQLCQLQVNNPRPVHGCLREENKSIIHRCHGRVIAGSRRPPE